MPGYIHACFSPVPLKKSGTTRDLLLGATACSSQSHERVFIPKIAWWALSIASIYDKYIAQAPAAALSSLPDFTIKMLDNRRTRIL